MTIQEAFAQWREISADIPADDRPMNSESWNNFTDSLCKDGELTDLQYHYCPAYDDDMPEDADAERDYLLDQMGVTITSTTTAPHLDAEGWDSAARHFWVTLARPNAKPVTVPFIVGSAIKGDPTREDVLHCLLMDWQTVDSSGSFEDWCDETGADDDSRKAERMYQRTKAASHDLDALFSDISLADLAAAFEDY